MTLVRRVLTTFGFLLLFVANSAQADSPTSCVGGICSTRAVVDTAVSTGTCYFQTGYNIPSGTIYTDIWGGIDDCWTWGYAKIQDDFVVDGIASGTLVPISARLDLLGRFGHVAPSAGYPASTQGLRREQTAQFGIRPLAIRLAQTATTR